MQELFRSYVAPLVILKSIINVHPVDVEYEEMHHWLDRWLSDSGINPASKRADWWKILAARPISSTILLREAFVVSCCTFVYFCSVRPYLSSSVIPLVASLMACQIPQCAPVRHTNLVSNSTHWREETRRKTGERNVGEECLSFFLSVSLLQDGRTFLPSFSASHSYRSFETSAQVYYRKETLPAACTWPLWPWPGEKVR